MTTLYRAVFDEYHFWGKRGIIPEKMHDYLTNTEHKIVFQHEEMIDRNQSQVLLLQKDGSAKWKGYWVPHSPFAENEEDAVQMLRWEVHPTSYSSNPEAFGGKEQQKLWIDLASRKTKVCEDWLKERNVEPIEPWWIKSPDRSIWVP